MQLPHSFSFRNYFSVIIVYLIHNMLISKYILHTTVLLHNTCIASNSYSMGCWINNIVARLSWCLIIEYHAIPAWRPSEPIQTIPWSHDMYLGNQKKAGQSPGSQEMSVVLCHLVSQTDWSLVSKVKHTLTKVISGLLCCDFLFGGCHCVVLLLSHHIKWYSGWIF